METERSLGQTVAPTDRNLIEAISENVMAKRKKSITIQHTYGKSSGY